MGGFTTIILLGEQWGTRNPGVSYGCLLATHAALEEAPGNDAEWEQ